MPKTTAIVFIVFFALEAVVIIIGNVFTIFVFWTQRIRVKTNLPSTDQPRRRWFFGENSRSNSPSDRKNTQRWRRRKTSATSLGGISSLCSWNISNVSRSYFAGTCFRRVEATASSRNKPSRLHLQHSYRMGARIVYGRAMGVNHVSPRHKYLVCDCHNTIFALVFPLVTCTSYLTVRSRLHRTAPALKDHTQNANERNLQLSKTFLMVVAVSILLWFPA